MNSTDEATRIVKEFVNLSAAHGYPVAQACTLEIWIKEALERAQNRNAHKATDP
jgi:hypothetical protein